MESRIDSAALKSELNELLRLTTMTIATIGKDGEPHAAGVYFASDEMISLFFFSDASSRHSLDTDSEPRAAVTVHGEGIGWQEIHGLQMRGVISAVQSNNEWQEAWVLYRTKFPFVIDLEEIIKTNQLYAFKPHWIRLVDNRQGFGFKQEWGKNGTEIVAAEAPGWRLLDKEQGAPGITNG